MKHSRYHCYICDAFIEKPMKEEDYYCFFVCNNWKIVVENVVGSFMAYLLCPNCACEYNEYHLLDA